MGTPGTKDGAPREVRRAIIQDPRQVIPKKPSLPHPDTSQMMGQAVTDARGRGFANIPCSRDSAGKSIPKTKQKQKQKKLSVSFKQAVLYIRRKGEGSGSSQSRQWSPLISKKELLTSPLSPCLAIAQTLKHGSTSVISELGFAVIFFFLKRGAVNRFV